MVGVSFEAFAPRSTEQVSRLSKIAALTAGPYATEELQENPDYIKSCMLVKGTDDGVKDPEVEAAIKASEGANVVLNHQIKKITSLKLAVRASINIAEDISNKHAELIRHSGELSLAADRLDQESKILKQHAEEIGKPLLHYDNVDKIGVAVGVMFKNNTVVRGLAKCKVDTDEFVEILSQIDDAVMFFGQEAGGKTVLEKKKDDKASTGFTSGNVEYYKRAFSLQEAALDLIREAVADRIETTTTNICNILQIPKKSLPGDQLEASLVYTRFHGIARRSLSLMELVNAKLNTSDKFNSGVKDGYLSLLSHCRSVYCHCRERLLKPSVISNLESLKDAHGAVGMTRLASVFLIRVCVLETNLYRDFFGNSDAADLSNYLSSLCNNLHRTVRRSLISMKDLDTLCQIVSVLREERNLASNSPVSMAASRSIGSIIEDAQERLIFCANSELTKTVIKFKPASGDLDYPGKLTKKDDAKGDDDDDAMLLYESWFPPLRSVLRILSKIFRVVEPSVFEDIALQSVQHCTRCLKDASTAIKSKSTQLDADLFLVKHLLILREQLSPFDIELRSVEKSLDFSNAGKAISRFLTNRRVMSTDAALLTLLKEGVTTQENAVDSKRDLEDTLRNACNQFIENTAIYLVTDKLVEATEAYKISDFDKATSKYSNPDYLLPLLNDISGSINDRIDALKTAMNIYLESPATQAILLKPVVRKLTRGLDDVRKINDNSDIKELTYVLEAAVKKAVN